MKTWETPDVEVVEIKATEHGWTGIYRDGGYIGDGHISGHLTWKQPSNPSNPSNPTEPTQPTDPVDNPS